MISRTVTPWLLAAMPLVGFSQSASPYHLSLGRDLILGGAAAASTVAGTILWNNVGPLTKGEIELDGISRFDIVATHYTSDRAARASDLVMYGSAVLPLALVADPGVRHDVVVVGTMFGEAILLTTGLTTIVKSTAQRARPYVYDENLPRETILSSNDRAAFLSGHTSAAATGAFFFAKVYADYHPDAPIKPFVWAAAGALPAVTGYLRVRSGRHYPSDVIAGYLLGAGVGVGVPQLHHWVRPIVGLRVVPGPSSLYASYTF